MTTRYQHSGTAVATTLASGITASTTSIPIADATGWPDGSVGPFWATLGRDTAAEEKIKVLSRTGTTLTLSGAGDRGADGTTPASHSAGTTVEHTISATEIDEMNAQLAATTALGGTTVTTSATQTLTGKTLNLASNTLAATLAQINAAISDADLVSLAGAETLLNKTLTSPVINQFGAASGLGAAWASYAPNFNQNASLAGTATAHYLQIGKLLIGEVNYLVTGGGSGAGNNITCSVPAAPLTTNDRRCIGTWSYRVAASDTLYCGSLMYVAGTVFMAVSDTAGVTTWFGTGPNVGAANGDIISQSYFYQVV